MKRESRIQNKEIPTEMTKVNLKFKNLLNLLIEYNLKLYAEKGQLCSIIFDSGLLFKISASAVPVYNCSPYTIDPLSGLYYTVTVCGIINTACIYCMLLLLSKKYYYCEDWF